MRMSTLRVNCLRKSSSVCHAEAPIRAPLEFFDQDSFMMTSVSVGMDLTIYRYALFGQPSGGEKASTG
jgi:hypothetical protein